MKLLVSIIALTLALGSMPALADVYTESNAEAEANSATQDPDLGQPFAGMTVTLAQGDGQVAKNGARAIAKNPIIRTPAGGLVEVEGAADVKVRVDTKARYIWVILLRHDGGNAFTVLEEKEYNWDNNGTNGWVERRSTTEFCTPGGTTNVASAVAAKNQGQSAVRWDRGSIVAAPGNPC